MNTSEGGIELIRVASQMKKDKKDVQGAFFMNDEDGNIIVDHTAVADNGKRYFE